MDNVYEIDKFPETQPTKTESWIEILSRPITSKTEAVVKAPNKEIPGPDGFIAQFY